MNFLAFSSYIFLTAFTPGPNNIMAMTNSAKYGIRRALVFCLGVLCGFLMDMTLCAVATSLLLEYIPDIEPIMKWIGAAYILFLAWVILRDKPGGEKKQTTLDPSGMFTGMILQLVNIKVILYGITALSTFVLPHHRSLPALALAVAVLSVVGFLGTCCWAGFGSLFQNVYAKHRKTLNIVMALTLVYCALMSLL